VENLWLAARAEGVGVGWVSILREDAIRRIFGIPDSIVPVAYLCVGYAHAFADRPLLERVGWAPPLSPRELLRFETWDNEPRQTENLARLVEDPTIWRDIFPDDG
jgi:5,6-dimethylbenzimidazole synthase